MRREKLRKSAQGNSYSVQSIVRPSSTEEGETDKRKYATRSRKARRAQMRLAAKQYVTDNGNPLPFRQWVEFGFEPAEYQDYVTRSLEISTFVAHRKRWRDLGEHERFIL